MLRDPLNPPERIAAGITAAAGRMALVDEALGEDRLNEFAARLSGLLAHGNPDVPGVAQVLGKPGRSAAATLFNSLMSTCCEFETAWNALRLGNVPASYRQGRVACEFLAVSVLEVIGRARLVRLPRTPETGKFFRILAENPHSSIVELWRPSIDADGHAIGTPKLESRLAVEPFLGASEHLLAFPADKIANFRKYRRGAQHPASHGSAEVQSHHTDGCAEGAFGIHYLPSRDETYRQAADDLIEIAGWLEEILRALGRYLLR